MLRNQGWFQVAEALGMGLEECMEKHTDRQMVMWLLYLGEKRRQELEHPGSLEHYLMRVCLEVNVLSERVRTLFGGKVVEPKLEQFRLKFGDPSDLVPKSAKVAATISRNVWASRVGADVVERRIPKAEGQRIAQQTAEEYQRFLEKTEEFRG